jgi:hypothetical protein
VDVQRAGRSSQLASSVLVRKEKITTRWVTEDIAVV